MKVGLLIICTNKYSHFLPQLIESADTFFLPNKEVEYYVFTDSEINIKSKRKINFIETQHKPWPWMTLGRYQSFTDNKNTFKNCDYVYYIDVDMKFVSTVGEEIISDLVATQHPYFFGRRGTPETNEKSLAFVSTETKMQYFAGGFNGGKTDNYLTMCNILSQNIKKDYENGIVAIWHDESHMNRYFIDNPPTKILNPSYCYPESGLNLGFPKKILALDKNHQEIRKE